MKVPDFVRGPIAPVITAWKDDESFDETGQRNLYDYMLESGAISAFFMRSGMGQMTVYEYEDVRIATRVACEHLRGKVPLIMNCSGIWDRDRASSSRPDPEVYTRQAVELSQYAEELGAESVAHVVPEALLPADNPGNIADTYFRHYETICSSVKIPVFVYHPRIPDPDKQFTPELTARLADIPNLVGMKVSTLDGYFLYGLLRAVQGKEFHVVTGAEMLFYATLPLGSRAVIGAGCNLNPQIIKAQLECYERGDQEGMLRAQDSINMLYEHCPSVLGMMKKLATAGGRPVGLTARARGKTVYGRDGAEFTDEAFQTFKRLIDQEVEKYT